MYPPALERALPRFWALVRVCPVTGCWHWQGGVSRGGQRTSHNTPYGSFWVERGLVLRAHVYVAWLFGMISGRRLPPGMNLDHTCENSLCVSPWHIELVTWQVNQDRRMKRVRRRRPTWAELYALRGIGTDAEAVEPRHLRGDDTC